MEIIRPEPKQKMPSDAKRVFKGVLYDVYQWEQEEFDGKVKTYEKLKRPDTVSVIALNSEKQILIAKQQQVGMAPFYSLMSGKVDPGENAFEAAQRELLEESGYMSGEWELLNSYQPSVRTDWAVFTFIARNIERKGEQQLEGGEKIELSFVDFDRFIEIALQPDFWEDDVTKLVTEAELDSEKMKILKSRIIGE